MLDTPARRAFLGVESPSPARPGATGSVARRRPRPSPSPSGSGRRSCSGASSPAAVSRPTRRRPSSIPRSRRWMPGSLHPHRHGRGDGAAGARRDEAPARWRSSAITTSTAPPPRPCWPAGCARSASRRRSTFPTGSSRATAPMSTPSAACGPRRGPAGHRRLRHDQPGDAGGGAPHRLRHAGDRSSPGRRAPSRGGGGSQPQPARRPLRAGAPRRLRRGLPVAGRGQPRACAGWASGRRSGRSRTSSPCSTSSPSAPWPTWCRLRGLNRAYVVRGPGHAAPARPAGSQGADGRGPARRPAAALPSRLPPRARASMPAGDWRRRPRRPPAPRTEDEAEAAAIAATLDRLNRERQTIEGAMLAGGAGRGRGGARPRRAGAGGGHGLRELASRRGRPDRRAPEGALRPPAFAIAFGRDGVGAGSRPLDRGGRSRAGGAGSPGGRPAGQGRRPRHGCRRDAGARRSRPLPRLPGRAPRRGGDRGQGRARRWRSTARSPPPARRPS